MIEGVAEEEQSYRVVLLELESVTEPVRIAVAETEGEAVRMRG